MLNHPLFNNPVTVNGLKMLCGLGLLGFCSLLWHPHSVFVLSAQAFSIGTATLGLDLIVDAESTLFFLSISWISLAVFSYSLSYMAPDPARGRFTALLASFVLSMWVLVFSGNFLLLLIGWDGLGVSSFLLVIYFQNKNSTNAGLVTMLTNRLGDVLIMLSLGLFLGAGGLSTCSWGGGGTALPPASSLLIVLAAFTKSAQLPFSSWLPAAMAAPTPVSSLVHSSTLVTAGIYVLVRFSGHLAGSNLMLATGAATMVAAGLAGLLESDFKKLVALSTLSQLGLMMSCLGLGGFQVTFYHLLVHAYFKALMFMATGSVIHSSGDCQDLRAISAPFSLTPWTSAILLVSNFSLMGLPFLGGFYSKDLLLEASMSGSLGVWGSGLFMAGTALTVLYALRFLVLSGASAALGGPALAPKDSDWTMLTSYDMLFFLAVGGGSLLNYVYLVFPPTLLLSPELKNGVLILILSSWATFTLSPRIPASLGLSRTLGALLGLTPLAKGTLKSAAFQSAHFSESLVEKFFLDSAMFGGFSQAMAPRYLHSTQSMASFWVGGTVCSLASYLVFFSIESSTLVSA